MITYRMQTPAPPDNGDDPVGDPFREPVPTPGEPGHPARHLPGHPEKPGVPPDHNPV